MRLKARFLRWLHCTIHLFSSKPHQSITIGNKRYIFVGSFPLLWVNTKYVGCSCGKEWFKNLTDIERQMLKYLQGFNCICLSGRCIGMDPKCPIHGGNK